MEDKRERSNWKETLRGCRIQILGVAAAILVTAVIGCFGVWSYNQYRRELIETEQKQLLTMAETVGTSLVNFVEQELDNIDLYFSLLETGGGNDGLLKAAVQAADAFLDRMDGLYTAMACYDGDGKLLFQQGSMDFGHRWLSEEEGATICGKRFCGDHYEMYISRRFAWGGRQCTAVYAMDLGKIYTRIVEPVKIGQGGYSVVKDKELSIIMHHAPGQIGMDAVYDRRQKYPQLDLTDLFDWIHMQEVQPEGMAVIRSYMWDDEDLTPERRIVAYTTVNLPGETWIVNSTLPFRELNGPLNRMLLRLLGLSGLFILLAGGLVFGMTKSLMRSESQKKEIAYLREINEGMELLRRKEDELQHYQRVQSLGQMSSHIAHEFNNYLTPVLLYGEMLREDPSISGENKKLIEGVLDAAEQAADLSRNLLDFSRQDAGGGMAVMDLAAEVKKAADMVRRLTPEHISFRLEAAEAPLYVRGKKGMAEHILMNLCNNAFHAMEGREGELTVTLSAGQPDNADPEAGSLVCLSVSDTGCGIPKDALKKIFEPFYTTKRSGKGTGLGLSVISNVMRSVGGQIQVESEPGKGTVFRLYFPLAEPEAEEAGNAESCRMAENGKMAEAASAAGHDRRMDDHASGHKKAERILLVDDDPEILKALSARLKQSYFVECYSHPAAALAKVQGKKAYCDCILTDFDMPSMNGLEFAEIVRRLDPGIRLILMSGAEDERFNWYLENGFIDEFILKSDLGTRLDSGL